MTRRLAVVLALCLSLLGSAGITATGRSGTSKGMRSTQASSGKTVHVKSYTKKDGTKVAAHDRKAPEKQSPAVTAEKAPKPLKTQPATITTSPTTSPVTRDEKARIQRSDAARHHFARQTGHPNGRPGYVIDHIVPLACGGADAPSNMQWQTIEAAEAKDKVERIGCR